MNMRRFPLPLPVFVLGVVWFHLFAYGDTIRAQGLNVRGVAQVFKNAEGMEPSAVEPIGDGTNLLIADDKIPELLIVNTTMMAVAARLRIPTTESKPKWEAMAKGQDGYYYLSGVRAGLFRFRLEDETQKDPTKINLRGEVEPLSISWPADLAKCGPFVIEGLATWTNNKNEELVFGIRDDGSDRVRTYRAKLTADKQLSPMSFFMFQVPKVENVFGVNWHLSSIEYVPAWEGFVIITATEDGANKFYGNKFWFVSAKQLEGEQASSACNLTLVTAATSDVFEPTMKAEGFAILTSVNSSILKMVIVFDNDYKNRPTKDQGAMAIVDLSRPTRKLSASLRRHHYRRDAKER